VNAIVIYESLTGNTKKAAGHIVDELIANGVSAVACPTTDVDYQALANADLVIVGSWTDGLFLFGQKPANAGRLAQIPFLAGKQAAVFCTYALETGKKRSFPIVVPRSSAEWQFVAINFRKAVRSSLRDCSESSPSD